MKPSSLLTLLIVCSWLSVLAARQGGSDKASAQQRAPEQSYTEWFANRQKLQAQAKRIYEAEMAREKAGDCPNASTTRDFEECYSKVLQTAEGSLKDFESSIRAFMTNPPDSSSAEDNLPGPAGPHLTSTQRSAEFEQVEHLWHDYQNSACAAAFHQYDGGTGGPPGELECEIRLVRNHLRELDLIYGIGLHL